MSEASSNSSLLTAGCLDNPGPDYSQHFFTFGRARPARAAGRKPGESPDLLVSSERRRRRDSVDWPGLGTGEEGPGASWSPPSTQETNAEPLHSSLGECWEHWAAPPDWGCVIVEISCISNQQTLPIPNIRDLPATSERMIETRFSLPANVFLSPSYVLTAHNNEGPAFLHGKYATLGKVRKSSGYSGGRRELTL